MQTPASPQIRKWQRFFAIYGGAAVVLVVGAVTYGALERAREARQLVAHTQLVIETLAATLSALQDAETGQRGYLITGADSYLGPYRHAMATLGADTTALRQLTRDNARQQKHLDTLAVLVGAKAEELRGTIDLRQTRGFAAAAVLVQTGRGKESMDAIRRVIGAMQNEEDHLVASRQLTENQRARLVEIILLAGTIVAALIGIVVNGLLTRYAEAQEAAARVLDAQNAKLQTQATELETQASQLEAQAAELEMANDELQQSADSLRGQTEEALRANTAKSEFLAAMSHELRTPLNAVVGYVDLLAMGIRGPTTDTQQEDLRRIKRSAEHLLSLINQILDLARVEARQIELYPARVVIAELIGDVVALVTPQMERKAITFSATCDPALVAQIDAERTRQILLNVLTNAQKFTRPGGRVAIVCANGVSSAGESGASAAMLSIRVVDTGRGIPAKKLDAIFESFVQLDRQLTPDGEQGLGLGLSISRDLARAMGGDLTVRSVVGEGSTFTLQLPLSGPGPTAPATDGLAGDQFVAREA
jgi:signal transduction histidine kinase